MRVPELGQPGGCLGLLHHKGGTVHGATDEYGYYAAEDPIDIHDLHATMLHLMGVDHERLVYRFDSRDMRLTDVRGKVVRPIVEA